jgi:hypothetical protein
MFVMFMYYVHMWMTLQRPGPEMNLLGEQSYIDAQNCWPIFQQF